MAKCCCCLPLGLGALLISIWFFVFGVVFGVLSFLNILYGTTTSAALIVQVGLFGILCLMVRKTSWLFIFMSVINAGLIFWYKDQYLGQCNNNSYLSKYFGVNGQTEEEVLQACQKYFQNVAIASIITTVVLGIMNLAFAVKLTQWLIQNRRQKYESHRAQVDSEQQQRREADRAAGKRPGLFDRFREQLHTGSAGKVNPHMSETGGPKPDGKTTNYTSGNEATCEQYYDTSRVNLM